MQLKKREIFSEPIIGEIDQGYIFCGGKSDLYPGRNVLGIIITPRCDIARNKTDEIYYLPVVQLNDWKEIEFPRLYCNDLLNDINSQLTKSFINLSLSPSIIDKFSVTDIRDILIERKIPKKSLIDISKKLDERSQIEKYFETTNNQIIENLLKEHPGIRKTILKELISNKLPNYYVIESAETYYIIRLRELKKLQIKIFRNIGKGLSYQELTPKDFEQNDIQIINPDEDLLFPIYVLRSPYIEHLMQCFIQWFSRIGVEDIDEHTCEYIIKNW